MDAKFRFFGSRSKDVCSTWSTVDVGSKLVKSSELHIHQLHHVQISLANQQFTNKYLLDFREKARINYTILRYDQKVLKDYFGYESPAIPTMILVDRQGKIRDKIVGFRPVVLEKALNELL